MENHGVTNPMFDPAIRARQESTMVERYGTKTPLESAAIRDKISQTNLERIGVSHPLQSKEIRDKAVDSFWRNNPDATDSMQFARQAFLDANDGKNPFIVYKDKIRRFYEDEHKVRHVKQKHISGRVYDILNDKIEFEKIIRNRTIYEIKRDLDFIDGTTVRRYLDKYGFRDLIASAIKSRHEFEIEDFLRSNNINYIRGNRSLIAPYELDFVIPDIKVAIELNGHYWHSETYKDRQYHKMKHDMVKAKGYHLFQFMDIQWDDEVVKEIIKRKILQLCGMNTMPIVGARKITKIELLADYTVESAFLDQNHIQGSSTNRSFTVGAWVGSTLMGVMCFREDAKRSETDLTRYATHCEFRIPGLFSKMLKWAISNKLNQAYPIVSFSDNNHSDGKLYADTGFTKVHDVVPSYHVCDGITLFRRERFMKANIKKSYPQVYDANKTEAQMIEELGFSKIWDSGKIKWSYRV
jgi:very-short-patch-repair endonuclease